MLIHFIAQQYHKILVVVQLHLHYHFLMLHQAGFFQKHFSYKQLTNNSRGFASLHNFRIIKDKNIGFAGSKISSFLSDLNKRKEGRF